MTDIVDSYKFGFYLDPQSDDPAVADLSDAETRARKLSVDNGGAPVAIWDSTDNTVKLFAGYEDFTPVKV